MFLSIVCVDWKKYTYYYYYYYYYYYNINNHIL